MCRLYSASHPFQFNVHPPIANYECLHFTAKRKAASFYKLLIKIINVSKYVSQIMSWESERYEKSIWQIITSIQYKNLKFVVK